MGTKTGVDCVNATTDVPAQIALQISGDSVAPQARPVKEKMQHRLNLNKKNNVLFF